MLHLHWRLITVAAQGEPLKRGGIVLYQLLLQPCASITKVLTLLTLISALMAFSLSRHDAY